MTSTHGGARPNSGRKPAEYPRRQLGLRMLDDEQWKVFLSLLPKDTRERGKYLFGLVTENSNEFETKDNL